MKKILIASDHAGFDLKTELVKLLADYKVIDLGTDTKDNVDYPDFAHKLALELKNNEFGILICGSGIGVSIAANRHKNIRAALCHNVEIAKFSRLHNDANVLCLGARFLNLSDAVDIIRVFLNTNFEGGRHQQRLDKI